MLNRQVMVVAVAIGLAFIITPRLLVWARRSAAPQKLAPYHQTPQEVVERLLQIAQVGRNDVVYDLGCGDGRMVITAAKKYGARGVGVDFDQNRVNESRANAEKAGVEALVEFRQQDALTVDVSPATVVMLYLLTSSNLKLRPILTKALRPGARIVSHQFAWATGNQRRRRHSRRRTARRTSSISGRWTAGCGRDDAAAPLERQTLMSGCRRDAQLTRRRKADVSQC